MPLQSTQPESLLDLMRSPPGRVPLTGGLIGVNALVFLAMLLAGAGLWHTSNGVHLAWGANFGPATQDGQWWRLASAMFVHFGLVHLVLNMLALWDVGRLIERLYGRWRFLLLYISSGVFGNLLSLLVQGNQAVSGGASGAVFSLYGAMLIFLWRERAQVDRREFRWLFGSASVFTVLMLGLGFVIPGIDNAAHGGGLLAGALFGSLLARPWVSDSPKAHMNKWFSAILLVALTGLMIKSMPQPRYLMGEEVKAREVIREFLLQDQRISQRLGSLLEAAPKRGITFEQLAATIEDNVTTFYQRSFETLSAAAPDPAAPSAPSLETLRNYAAQRADASLELAEGLRSRDEEKIRHALEEIKKAKKL